MLAMLTERCAGLAKLPLPPLVPLASLSKLAASPASSTLNDEDFTPFEEAVVLRTTVELVDFGTPELPASNDGSNSQGAGPKDLWCQKIRPFEPWWYTQPSGDKSGATGRMPSIAWGAKVAGFVDFDIVSLVEAAEGVAGGSNCPDHVLPKSVGVWSPLLATCWLPNTPTFPQVAKAPVAFTHLTGSVKICLNGCTTLSDSGLVAFSAARSKASGSVVTLKTIVA
mmetsp:Transcript_111012/g.313035  ORF Transcript_111012/g.313035 Transcript_111012/m.313035 type:complete len:225 (+) Transcript_111012:745-1419(+)